MHAWLVLLTWSAMRAGGLAGCTLLVACATSGESFWSDHAALMLRPSRHEVGVAFSYGAGQAREERGAGTGVASRIAAAIAPARGENPLPGAGSIDFRSGRLYIHAPMKH